MSASLLGLFGVSFLAATLLPAQSELGLSGLIEVRLQLLRECFSTPT